MQARKPRLTENKLLMLYAINRLGPITTDQAMRFFVNNDFLDYIDLHISLAELVEGGLLLMSAEPLGKTYSPSVLGSKATLFFLREVPDSRLKRVDELYPKWREIFLKESRIFADYEKNMAGELVVRLAAREEGMLMFEMSISVPGKAQAQEICKRWTERSGDIYAKIMELLLSSGDPEV